MCPTDEGKLRNSVIDYVTEQKEKDPGFTVIDLCGTYYSWAKDATTSAVDLDTRDDRPAKFKLDVTSQKDLDELIKYVEENGKFDYAISSHTLEDLPDYRLLLATMPKIAKKGIVLVPSIYTETSCVESPYYMGYRHHYWTFFEKEGKIYSLPKELIPMDAIHPYEDATYELVFEWEGDKIEILEATSWTETHFEFKPQNA